HPRLRFYFGREDELPIDQDLLGALVAPRHLLYLSSLTDSGLYTWSSKQNYYSVKIEYDFLDVTDNIGVLTRMGSHGVAARDVEQTIDFLDIHFKRIRLKWTNNLYYTYDYEKWRANHPGAQESAEQLTSISLKENYSDIR